MVQVGMGRLPLGQCQVPLGFLSLKMTALGCCRGLVLRWSNIGMKPSRRVQTDLEMSCKEN